MTGINILYLCEGFLLGHYAHYRTVAVPSNIQVLCFIYCSVVLVTGHLSGNILGIKGLSNEVSDSYFD